MNTRTMWEIAHDQEHSDSMDKNPISISPFEAMSLDIKQQTDTVIDNDVLHHVNRLIKKVMQCCG